MTKISLSDFVRGAVGCLCVCATLAGCSGGSPKAAQKIASAPIESTPVAEANAPLFDYSGLDTLAFEEKIPLAERSAEVSPELFNAWYEKPVMAPPFNFDFNVDTCQSIPTLHYLKQEIYARHGYLFRNTTDRFYFESRPWYQPIWWDEQYYFSLSKDEKTFIGKIDARLKALEPKQYKVVGKDKTPNVAQILNRKQFSRELTPDAWKKLERYGFCLVPSKYDKLSSVYLKNRAEYAPSIVTTDLYLELSRLHVEYTRDYLEKRHGYAAFSALTDGTLNALKESHKAIKQVNFRSGAEYNMIYWAVAGSLLYGRSLENELPNTLREIFRTELEKCKHAAAQGSLFLENRSFDYTLFQPRGRYIQNDTLLRFYQATVWLQNAPFYYDSERQLDAAVVLAGIYNQKPELQAHYTKLMEILTFENAVVSQTRRFSRLQDAVGNAPETHTSAAKHDALLAAMDVALDRSAKDLHTNPNRKRLTFLPEIVRPENELSALISAENSSAGVGLTLAAATGNFTADYYVKNSLPENRKANVSDSLRQMQAVYRRLRDENSGLYRRRTEAAEMLVSQNATAPPLFRSVNWQKKTLLTTLSARAALRHEAPPNAPTPVPTFVSYRYADALPAPVLVGYVEPNIFFWESAQATLQTLEKRFSEGRLRDSTLAKKTAELKLFVEKLCALSEKEIKGETLSQADFRFIEDAGVIAERLARDIYPTAAPPNTAVSAAFVSELVTYKQQRQTIQGGTGLAYDIYVVCEIGGRLYLTRGASYSYAETRRQSGRLLNDYEWQALLGTEQAPAAPAFLKDVVAAAPEKIDAGAPPRVFKRPDAQKQKHFFELKAQLYPSKKQPVQ